MNQLSQPGHMGHASPTRPGQKVGMSEELIDVTRLLRAIMRYKWAIMGLAFAITLATGMIVSSMQPIYRASASIVLETQEANLVGVEDVYTIDGSNYYYMATQLEILKSRDLAERVVRRLQLHKHPIFAVKEEAEQEKPWYYIDLTALLPASEKRPPLQLSEEEQEELAIAGVTGAVAGGLSISPVEFSHIAYVSYESPDPRLAARVVNAIAEEFINSNLESRLAGTLQATDWLNSRLADLKRSLRDSEEALQDFRDQEGLVDIEGVTGLGGNELQILSQRLEDARKARIEAQNIKEEVQGMRGASTEELMTVPAVLKHQVIGELKRTQSGTERRVSELTKRYGQLHPKMIAAQSDLSAASEELANEVRKVVSGISREYEIALRNEQQLQATWESRRSEMQAFNRTEFRLQELQREAETNRQLYDIFFTRIKNVSETGGFERPHARFVDRAMVPGGPIRPNKRMSVMAAFALGLLLGCGIAILLDILDNTVKTPDDVQDKLGSPLLGIIPKQKVNKSGDFDQFWENPQSQYAEAIRTIRTGLLLSSLDKPAKVILVTSTEPGEGKSTTVLNLGAALAQMEKVLVIGGDLRRPSLARKCGVSANHKGLSQFVSGVADLEDSIEYIDALGLHVMPAGVIPPNPLELISSNRFVEALKTLQDRFDRIVIDSAPVQAVSDALILASYADSVIYVIKADATSATQAQKGIASLVASSEPSTGVVLNQFDTDRANRYHYSGKYYQYIDYSEGGSPG